MRPFRQCDRCARQWKSLFSVSFPRREHKKKKRHCRDLLRELSFEASRSLIVSQLDGFQRGNSCCTAVTFVVYVSATLEVIVVVLAVKIESCFSSISNLPRRGICLPLFFSFYSWPLPCEHEAGPAHTGVVRGRFSACVASYAVSWRVVSWADSRRSDASAHHACMSIAHFL